MNTKRFSGLYVVLCAVFVSTTLVSNIVAAKQVELTPFLRYTGGILVFPIVYILSDIFSEVYGYQVSRRIAWLTFALNLFMVIVFELAILLPFPLWYTAHDAFAVTLGSSPRIVCAGLFAFQIGDWLNDVIFQKMRSACHERFFCARAILSSVVGEVADSTVFTVIAFIGSMPLTALSQMVLTGVLLKCVYEIVFIPVTMALVKKIKRYEGVFKPASSYSIFG
ncbi:MAG: queuosine precursor transporter [Treponema sp.]|jgi:uncharacterized integral membrane protein (TIGR00697 family)|nr:queuosine precursor transporter [Treponema sp.]